MMHLRHTYHTGRTARTLLILAMLCHMAITFSCSGNRTKDAMTENRRESLSADSLYEDPVAAKAMLDSMMKSTDDSLTYHYLMSYYLKPCAILRQYDSVTYYGGLINRFAESHRQIYEKDSVYRKMMENMFYTQGAMYSILRKADSALVYLRKAYGFSQKEYRIRILLAVGETYYRIGNYPRSVFHYREAMMLNDSLGQPINPYTISGGLAQTYLQSHDYDQAEKYLKLSINGYDSMDNIDKLFLLNSFGNLYYNKKEYAKALPFFAKADSMTKADKALASNMYIARMNMCEIYILLSMFDSAKVCLDEISPYFSSSGNEIYRYHLSTLKFALCSKEKDMQKAARMIRKMERTLNEGPEDLKTIRERYMRDYYAEAGLFDKAYRMEHHIAGKDDSLRKHSGTDQHCQHDTAIPARHAAARAKKLHQDAKRKHRKDAPVYMALRTHGHNRDMHRRLGHCHYEKTKGKDDSQTHGKHQPPEDGKREKLHLAALHFQRHQPLHVEIQRRRSPPQRHDESGETAQKEP